MNTRRLREIITAVVAVAAIVVGAAFAVLLPAAPAHAGFGGWGGTGTAYAPGIAAGGTSGGPITIANTSGSSSLTISPAVATALGISMRSDNLVKLLSFGTNGNEYIGGYLAASTSTLTVTQHGSNSPAISISGALVQPPAAVSISSPTDTTTSAFQVCSYCTMSSSGVAAWTPAVTNAASGMQACFLNTGTNVITMTAGANYVGPGSAVGQNDVVCMVFNGTTSKWVETNFQNNP